MKYEKEFYVTGAVYRMLKTKKIDRQRAMDLLQKRAKFNPDLSKRVVELWFTSYDIRKAWGHK